VFNAPVESRGRFGLRSLFVAGVATLFAAAAAFWAWSLSVSYELALVAAEERVGAVARVVEEHARVVVEASKAVVWSAAFHIERVGFETALAQTAPLRDLDQTLPQIGALWVLDAKGTLRFATTPNVATGTSFADSDFFRAHRDGVGSYVGPALRSSATGRTYFTVSQRLEQGGAFAGVVVASIDLDYLANFHASLNMGPQSTIGVAKEDGKVIMHFPDPSASAELRLTISDPAWAKLAGRTAAIFASASSLDHIDRIYAFRKVPLHHLIVWAGISRHEALAPWRAELRRSVWPAGITGTIIVALAAFGLAVVRREEEARAALARVASDRELLLHELSHRVKNNLQMVQSMLSLKAMRQNDPALRRELKDAVSRVAAVARVYADLNPTGTVAEIDCGHVIRTTLEALLAVDPARDRVRLVFDLASIPCAMKGASPLLLIVNEVATNALKHAFPDGREGEIRVSLKKEEGFMRLRIADNGVGMPVGPVRAGSLGLFLVEKLAQQIGATFSLESVDGTRFEILIPLARLQAEA